MQEHIQKPLTQYKKPLGIFRNPAIQAHIRGLDAATEHQEIIRLMIGYEFPWDMTRALEMALFRTFASPSVSALLDRTGEFGKAGQKRYDDTGVLIGEFMQNGYDSPKGKRAIAQMNMVHSHFNISNEDYLFVLSTFIFDPIVWLEAYGWRKPLEVEKQALFYFFCEVGKRMNLEDIPETMGKFREFVLAYQAKYFEFSPSNQRVAEATLKIVKGWYPSVIHFLIKPATVALIDEDMRLAFGFKRVSPLLKSSLKGLLKLRRYPNRVFNWEKSPMLLENSLNRTYPKGYEIEQIGPHKIGCMTIFVMCLKCSNFNDG
jgi:hypothetical protein